MFNVIFDGREQIKPEEKKYQILKLFDDKVYEADDFRDLAAVLCGADFYESQCAETDWHMRVAAAKQLGLAVLSTAEIEAEQREEIGEDEDLDEFIIVYDERIGKIPYSMTGPDVDYDIHVADPMLIRVESNESFLWTLAKAEIILVRELDDETGEYIDWRLGKDLDSLIAEKAEFFRIHGDQTRVPLFKKLGE